MTVGVCRLLAQVRILAALCARALQEIPSPFRKQRAQGRPGARRTRGPVCKDCAKSAHGSNHRSGGITPAFPAQWFTAYFALSSVNQLICHRRKPRCISIVANLAPAWARQDHTTSPSTLDAARQTAPTCPPHPALNVRDDAYAPCVRGGTPTVVTNFGKKEREIFFARGLDAPNRLETAHEIRS